MCFRLQYYRLVNGSADSYLFSFSSMNSWSLSSGYCTTLTRTGCALWRSLRTSCTLRSSLHMSDMTSWFMSFMPSSSSSVSVPEGTSDESTWVTDSIVVTAYKPGDAHNWVRGCSGWPVATINIENVHSKASWPGFPRWTSTIEPLVNCNMITYLENSLWRQGRSLNLGQQSGGWFKKTE